ncbi:Gmad2 immunoglobulin-like domain-containing protein [Alkaliphilus sp. B6464]|uniref:Gmad2 immunoglobulin-like domain-containing protein n=1 Tax=Alkaliphilus sp. B6464 TaxID=2731219 RepID=UPI001BA75427|nr:Gmad2 immunoglobulin-like domain-containing protein [Alkaliphilus sp. B6464]QUH19987.1 protease complex subunit PrcB family protein [Alkaliphilus sp. B6464]
MKVSKIGIFKNRVPLLLISMLLAITITGCNISKGPTPSEKPEDKIDNNIDKDKEAMESRNTIDESIKNKMKIVEEESILEAAKEWFHEFDKIEGAYVFQHPDATYIRINSKERPTGGYSIHIKDYSGEEYHRVIKFEIVEPKEGEIVSQAITYPSVILEIPSDSVGQYEIRTKNEEVFKSKEKLILAKLELPKENEGISNPVRIKGKIIAFEGAFSVRVLDDKDKVIYEEHLQADAGGPNWGKFDTEITYPKPNSESGSIEIGEYTAKEGEYVARDRVSIKFSE